MTPTNTDYLLQVTTPVTDRTYGAAGTNGGADKFDDHLSQASTYSGDDSHNLSGGSYRTDRARYERDDRSWNTNRPKPSSHDNRNSTSSQTSQTSQEEASGGVNGSTTPSDDADGDDHESDKSDDSTAAEVAGASQTKDNSPKPGAKSESNTNAPATAKAAAISKKAAAETGDPKSTGTGEGQGTTGSTSTDAATKHVEEAAKGAADAANTNEVTAESDATSEGKQSKGTKGDAATAKSTKGANAKNDSVSGDQPVDAVRTGDTAAATAKKATEGIEPSTPLAGVTAANSKSDAEDASDDDSHTGLKNDNQLGGNDTSAATNKVDAAQLAGSVPSTTDASANLVLKGKDDDSATKPIVAKGEPAAAAFARMARNNVTDSSESASGTNDLPPIDPSRFIGRVAKAFQTAQDRGGTLQLRLSPPELGPLRIELNIKDGVMSASLQTETANARRLLLDHLPALRDRLAEQNIRVDRFDVDVRQEGSSGQADTRGSQQQQFQNQADQPSPRQPTQPRAREVALPETISIAPTVSDAGLNLIV